MWESIKGFFRRHRRKFLVTGVVIGGVYLLGRYARWRLAEWQRQREMEYVEQARKQHHFESNLRTCTVTLFSLVPSLRDALMEKLNCETITSKLREKPANKLELWEQLKILSFTRTLSSIYSSCMLFVFLRVQLNIVGGYLYLDSLIPTAENSNGRQVHIGEGLQKRYLALVRYLLGDGLDFLLEKIRRSVEGKARKGLKLNKIGWLSTVTPQSNFTRVLKVLIKSWLLDFPLVGGEGKIQRYLEPLPSGTGAWPAILHTRVAKVVLLWEVLGEAACPQMGLLLFLSKISNILCQCQM